MKSSGRNGPLAWGGDSFSVVELFGAVPVSVAINVDQHVAALATHSYAGRDLREACELVRHAR